MYADVCSSFSKINKQINKQAIINKTANKLHVKCMKAELTRNPTKTITKVFKNQHRNCAHSQSSKPSPKNIISSSEGTVHDTRYWLILVPLTYM